MTDVFMNGEMLILMAALPLLFLLFVMAEFSRRKAIILMLGTRMSKQLLDPTSRQRRRITELCLLSGFVLIVIALARPVWDTELIVHPKTGRDLVFLLDISQSMLAEDQPPNRLGCAKNSILQCLDKLQSGRVGLVIFAGSTSIRCPLTRDIDFFRSTLDELEPDSVPFGGTRIGDAINKTVDKVLTDEDADFRDVILITDGGDQGSITTNSVAGLINGKVRLIIIGLGSDSISAPIPVPDEHTGKIAPLTYRDNIVRTRQDTVILEKLASMVPNSIYLNVGTNPLDLADIYKTHVTATMHQSVEELSTDRPKEQFWRFLLPAIFLLTASFLPGMRWTNSLANSHKTIVLITLLTLAASPLRAESRARVFDKAISAYKNGNFDTAIEQFHAADSKKPDPAIKYNIGTTYYRKGDMPSAISYFEQAAEASTDKTLSINSFYNLGNSLFGLAFSEENSTRDEAMNLIRQSIDAYESALEINPDHEDALFNLDIARKALEIIKKSATQKSDKKGTEKSDIKDDMDPTQEGDTTDAKNTEEDPEYADEKQPPPNLTPEDIINEETKNKLDRSRKKFAGFGNTKKNW